MNERLWMGDVFSLLCYVECRLGFVNKIGSKCDRCAFVASGKLRIRRVT